MLMFLELSIDALLIAMDARATVIVSACEPCGCDRQS